MVPFRAVLLMVWYNILLFVGEENFLKEGSSLVSFLLDRPKRSGTMYILQRAIKESFCGAFFKKRQRKTALFFLRSFFFCAYATKRKSERMKTMSLSINAECTKNPTLAVILSGAKRSRTFLSQIPNVTTFRLILTSFGFRLRSG